MKRIIVYILILLLVAAIASCARSCVQDISLSQPVDQIEQIELVYSPWRENKILYALTEEEIEPFLESLFSYKLHKCNEPRDIGGSLYVKICYSDVDIEIIGTSSVGYTSDGELVHDGWFYISYDDIEELFSMYVEVPA